MWHADFENMDRMVANVFLNCPEGDASATDRLRGMGFVIRHELDKIKILGNIARARGWVMLLETEFRLAEVL